MKFTEEQIEYQEVEYQKEWYLVGPFWGRWQEMEKHERWGESKHEWETYYTKNLEEAPALAGKVSSIVFPGCYARAAEVLGDWTSLIADGGVETEPQFGKYPKPAENWDKTGNPGGNSCEEGGAHGKIENYTQAAPVYVEREVNGLGFRFRGSAYVLMPNRKPLEGPTGKPNTGVAEPTPGEVTHKLNKKGSIGPATKKHINHAIYPTETIEPTIPNCTGLLGTECVALIEAEGFSNVELDPLTWKTADLTKPADMTIDTSPQEGKEEESEELVKVIANPAVMPLIVPTPGPGGENYEQYKEDLEKAGFTNPVEKIAPESGIDTKVGPGDVTKTAPAEGTRVDPAHGSDPVEVEVNPGDAPVPPPPEGETPIGGPSLPGFDSPDFGVLCKGFPFGVPCWLAKTIEGWSATPKAPVWGIGSFTVEGHKVEGGGFDLAKLEPVMEKVRPAMIVFATIGIVLLFYRLAKGGSPASGGTGDAPGSTSTDESER
jgi:hypothetical protein